MAKRNDKLEHRSAKEKFPPHTKLSAQRSGLQHPVEAANPVLANRQQSPQTETDPAYTHALHWWRFRIALALYTGAFPNSMRRQSCSVRYVSYPELLKQYQARPLHRRR